MVCRPARARDERGVGERALVTNNTKHFERVTGLVVENWVT
jgi:hypothetical protein